MTHFNHRSNSCIQIISTNNYKYDKFGFLIVNNVEDLLYDKFNNNAPENIFGKYNGIKNNKYQNINRRRTYMNNYYFKSNFGHFTRSSMRNSHILPNGKFKNYSYKKYKYLFTDKAIKSIPKAKKSFFTKRYSQEINPNKRILTIPKSSLCYFDRKKELIMINVFKPLIPVKNNQYFLSKEIINPKVQKIKKICNNNSLKRKPKINLSNQINKNQETPKILIKILQSRISSISCNKKGKISIKAKWNTIDEKELDKNNKFKEKILPFSADREREGDNKKIKSNFPLLKRTKIKNEIKNNSISKNNILNKNFRIIDNDKDKDLSIEKIAMKKKINIKSATHKKDVLTRTNSMFSCYKIGNKIFSLKNKNKNRNKNKGFTDTNDYLSLYPAIGSYFKY